MASSSNTTVQPGKKFHLSSRSPGYDGPLDKETGISQLEVIKSNISRLQEKLYAGGERGLLIVLQAMDAGGKDSLISHVFNGINPQGCQVTSFKVPGAEDYTHDFLWRHNNKMPGRGMIAVHNRSHYEHVLICRVHPELILKEHLPGIGSVKDIPGKFWEKRFESIRNFESHLVANGISILKFFLHISPEEQKKRFMKRLTDPDKHWKFAEDDLTERKHWTTYMEAYEEAIRHTSTGDAPWYVIPSDKKWYSRLTVAGIIEAHLESLDLQYPDAPDKKTMLAKAEQMLKFK